MELAGERVCRVLDRIAASRDLPERIVIDNGPELTSKALDYNHVRPHSSLGYLPPDAPCSEAGEDTVRLSPRSIRRSGFPAAVAELSVSPLGRLPASVPG